MIAGFILAHLCLLLILLGFVMPRYYDVFVPPHRRSEGTEETIANEPKGQVIARAVADQSIDDGEAGLTGSHSVEKFSAEDTRRVPSANK